MGYCDPPPFMSESRLLTLQLQESIFQTKHNIQFLFHILNFSYKNLLQHVVVLFLHTTVPRKTLGIDEPKIDLPRF
jgi:hypothetical protein